MSQSPMPDAQAANPASAGISWKQAINNGVSMGVGAIICAIVLGVYGAIQTFLRGSLPEWLHALATDWLVTICAVAAIFALGFVIGVSYAAVASM